MGRSGVALKLPGAEILAGVLHGGNGSRAHATQ